MGNTGITGNMTPEMAAFLGKLTAWRSKSLAEQLAWFRANPPHGRPKSAAPPAIDPAVRDRVLACPSRGPEGGLPLLDSERTCCGGGPEMTACARGLGKIAGRVSLRNCLDCQTEAIESRGD